MNWIAPIAGLVGVIVGGALNVVFASFTERRRRRLAGAVAARLVAHELDLVAQTVAQSLADNRWGSILDPGLPYSRGLWAVEHRGGQRESSAWPGARVDLAASLSSDDWDAVSVPYALVDGIALKFWTDDPNRVLAEEARSFLHVLATAAEHAATLLRRVDRQALSRRGDGGARPVQLPSMVERNGPALPSARSAPLRGSRRSDARNSNALRRARKYLRLTRAAPAPPQVPLEPTASRYEIARYEAYRAQVEHEDHLLGMRLGWLIASEAFLFAAYAVGTSAPHDSLHPPNASSSRLLDLLPVLGIGISLLVFLAIGAAIRALQRLRNRLADLGIPDHFPLVVAGGWTHRIGLIPPLAIPAAVIGAWIQVAIGVL